jgi:HEPN domain-containing protein
MSAHPDNAADPRAWLARAESSLARARAGYGVPGVLLEDLCFDAQQAVERSLKALLISRSAHFPKTHAIERLPKLLEEDGLAVPDPIKDAIDLSPYAVATRYPGGPAVTEEDYRAATKVAERVVAWARDLLPASA